MKEKFFVFLDIDGVLYDMEFCKHGRNKKGGVIKEFKKESVDALNHLLNRLEKDFDANLVISSTWRINLERTSKILKENGLEFDKPILATPILPRPEQRGREIAAFLDSMQEKNGNFVIIDDESFDFDQYFDNSKIIKTNFGGGALSSSQVERYLQNLFLESEKD